MIIKLVKIQSGKSMQKGSLHKTFIALHEIDIKFEKYMNPLDEFKKNPRFSYDTWTQKRVCNDFCINLYFPVFPFLGI